MKLITTLAAAALVAGSATVALAQASGGTGGSDQATELPQDFVLALSERGRQTRRCRLMWTANDQAGVEFERPKKEAAA